MKININQLDTEKINTDTINIDMASSLEITKFFNNEDKTVAFSVEKQLPNIAKVIDIAYDTLSNKGRLIYLGAGNSGRLAAGDACECVPTFGVSDDVVLYVLAGGHKSLLKANEGAEDCFTHGIDDLKSVHLNSNDFVVGLSASGRTPYVQGGLEYANSLGCKTASIVCSKNSIVSHHVDVRIELLVGPEVITGSTRLKAGTAQKMVLNMISSGVMIRLGKVYKNYMIDVSVNNAKLFERGKKIIKDITNVSDEEAERYLNKSQGKVKNAVLMIIKNVSYKESLKLLDGEPKIHKHI